MNKYHPVFFDIETTSLNPMQEKWWSNKEHDARVVCVGFGTIRNWRDSLSGTKTEVVVFDDESEYHLIKNLSSNLYNWLEETVGDVVGADNEYFFVGWNNRKFDHPYYGARAARLRLTGHPITHGWKRLDCFRVVKKMTGSYWKQDDWMDEIGIRHDDENIGSDVPELFGKGRIDKIRKHCNADVRDLIQIFLNNREKMMEELFSHYDDISKTTFKEPIDLE